MYVNHYNRVDYNFGAIVNINEPMEVMPEEADEVEVEDVAIPFEDGMDDENTQTKEEVKIEEGQPTSSESISYRVENPASRKSYSRIKIGLVAAAVIGALLFINYKK